MKIMIYLGMGILIFVILVRFLVKRDFFSKLATAFMVCSLALVVINMVMDIPMLVTLAKGSFCVSIVSMTLSFLVHLFDLD